MKQRRNFKIRISNISLKKNVYLLNAESSHEALKHIEPLMKRLGMFKYSGSSHANRYRLTAYYMPWGMSRSERTNLSRKGHMMKYLVRVDVICLHKKSLQTSQTSV